MSENLVEAILAEQTRCRALIEEYRRIGPAGAIGAAMVQQDIDAGNRALASDDAVAMVRALTALRGCE